MAASTTKKVLIVRFDRESLEGFVSPQEFLKPDGIELLTAAGMLAVVPYTDIKVICFVRDFGNDPLSGMRRCFTNRPKSAGLWVRMRFRDGEEMEGLLSNDLLHAESAGFTFTPPEQTGDLQRLFVPKAALRDIHVLAVIGSALRPKKPKTTPPDERQLKMFGP